jgi:hypothetical protein
VTRLRDDIGVNVAYGGVMLRESCARDRAGIGARRIDDVRGKVRPFTVGSLRQAPNKVDRTMKTRLSRPNPTYATGEGR